MIPPLLSAGTQVVKHSIMRTISVLCVIAIVILLGLGVKRILYPKPTESYSQLVEAGGTNYNIEVYNPEDTFFLGIKFWGLKLGISKPTVKKIKDITAELKPVQVIKK